MKGRQAGVPDRAQFQQIYLKSVEDVLCYWTAQMQDEISKHNQGWQVARADFSSYLRQSELRYWIACNALWKAGPLDSLCDVGGFFGVFPLTMQRLGVDVVMTEAIDYYSDSFSPLFAYLRSEGINIINLNPFEQTFDVEHHFDAVTAMAVIEHYPHSHDHFLAFMRSIVTPNGHLYIEVPNIAYWPKRLALMCGHSPLPAIKDVYKSAVPFTGHHHEFTMDELYQLAELSNLQIIDEIKFNYSFTGPWIKRFISDPLLTLMSSFPSMRECLAVVLKAQTVDAGKDKPHG